MKTKLFTMRMPVELMDVLKQQARADYTSISVVIKKLIIEHLISGINNEKTAAKP